MNARQVALELESERFQRFGIEQGAMRRVCHIILEVQARAEVDLPTLLAALEVYPALDFHADKEPFLNHRAVLPT